MKLIIDINETLESKDVLEALEKQIPKKIHKYANGEIHCPSCDCNLTGGFESFKYCIECGQKIKEGEEDET